MRNLNHETWASLTAYRKLLLCGPLQMLYLISHLNLQENITLSANYQCYRVFLSFVLILTTSLSIIFCVTLTLSLASSLFRQHLALPYHSKSLITKIQFWGENGRFRLKGFSAFNVGQNSKNDTSSGLLFDALEMVDFPKVLHAL